MTAAIYIRVSTAQQAEEGYSLDAQERTLREFCRREGLTVYKVYVDAGVSGKDITHREQMQAMLLDAEQRRFERIVVWSLSRFTRSVADLYFECENLSQHGVDLISYTEKFDTSTAMGRAMRGIIGVFAQMEREVTAERTVAGLAERAKQGATTTHCVLGYNYDTRTAELCVNEREAEVVYEIYTEYIKTANLSAVAAYCRDNGYIGKRGGEIRANTVRAILTCPLYIGLNSYHGEKIQGNVPPIIERSLYDEVQRIINRPRAVPRGRRKTA